MGGGTEYIGDVCKRRLGGGKLEQSGGTFERTNEGWDGGGRES